MSDPERPEEHAADADVRSGRGISVVWLIPIVAAVIGAILAYRAISERGPTIKITFDTAAGIEAGKTTLRYKAVEYGTVDEVHVADDLSHVYVTATLIAEAERVLVEGTRFWVVRPRVGAGGISGLSTLVSGAYIDTDPGPPGGKSLREFAGLPQPPLDTGDGSLRIVLRASELGSVKVGAPVYYRGFQVGEVVREALADDGKGIELHASIAKPHAKLLRKSSRFWRVAGINVDAGLTGVKLDVGTLESLLAGGVVFETPGGGEAAQPGDVYTIYESRADARRETELGRGRRLIVEAPTLGSLKRGDAVSYREENVGRVLSHELHKDARTVGILIEIDPPYHRLVRTNTVFWNSSGISADLGLTGLHVHTESLAALMAGGISFATPDKPGAIAAAGSVFALHPKGKDDWQKWSPNIWLGALKDAPAGTAASGAGSSGDADSAEVKHHHKGAAAADPESHHWFHGLFHHGD